MYKKIRKRNGKLVDFDSEKVALAIGKAGKATEEFGPEVAEKLAKKVMELAPEKIRRNIPTVEELQDVVEEVLLASKYKKTARAYIIYRQKHAEMRDLAESQRVELMDQYINNSDWQVKENANMAYSLQGLNNYVAGEVSKSYWLNKIYTPEIGRANREGDLHIHDLSSLSVYCVGWDLQDLITSGFRGATGKIECRAPKHLDAALGQLVNFFYTLQGEAAGAEAVSNFDTLLAPFIRYDKLDRKQVKNHLQSFMYNMNVPTRVGFQTPFTNITMDLVCPATLADEPVIIGGKPQKETYKEFQKEMDLFNDVFTEVVSEGDASGRVFTFPIPTYNVTKEFDWENPNLDGLWKMTAKYGIPYFSNFINSDMDPADARSMCCRLRLDNRELRKRGGGLFGANPLTGSVGVVTINLPRIGYRSRDKREFFYNLAYMMDLAKESLETKRKILENFTEKGLYPYCKFYLRNIFKRDKRYWGNHFSTIGLVGMNEAALNLLGRDLVTADGQQFAREVLDFMREKVLAYQEETGNFYNLEATPAEGTSHRLALRDKERYPDIMVANEDAYQEHGEAPYYTNSSHTPVDYTNDIFELLDLQDDLQVKYTGGTVVHLFVGEEINDVKAMKKLIKTICENYRLPYFTITPTFSICQEHGYIAGKVPVCEKCGKQNEVYSRIVGYIRPVQQWNNGKRAEFGDRTSYQIAERAAEESAEPETKEIPFETEKKTAKKIRVVSKTAKTATAASTEETTV
ncbi:MAG TPA: ribonucleoside triphosphate reductase [bacterium]|nr:ribonucleoside triphosphate reductase [bacterium]